MATQLLQRGFGHPQVLIIFSVVVLADSAYTIFWEAGRPPRTTSLSQRLSWLSLILSVLLVVSSLFNLHFDEAVWATLILQSLTSIAVIQREYTIVNGERVAEGVPFLPAETDRWFNAAITVPQAFQLAGLLSQLVGYGKSSDGILRIGFFVLRAGASIGWLILAIMNGWLAFVQRDSGKVANRYVVRDCVFSSAAAVALGVVTIIIGRNRFHVPLLLFNQIELWTFVSSALFGALWTWASVLSSLGIETADQNSVARASFEMSARPQQPEQVHVNSASVHYDSLSESGLFGQEEASSLYEIRI